jgi:hypothetical protein
MLRKMILIVLCTFIVTGLSARYIKTENTLTIFIKDDHILVADFLDYQQSSIFLEKENELYIVDIALVTNVTDFKNNEITKNELANLEKSRIKYFEYLDAIIINEDSNPEDIIGLQRNSDISTRNLTKDGVVLDGKNIGKKKNMEGYNSLYELNFLFGYDFNLTHAQSSFGQRYKTNANPGFIFRAETHSAQKFNLGMGFGTSPLRHLRNDKKSSFAFMPVYAMIYYIPSCKYINLALKANCGISLLMTNNRYDNGSLTKSGFYFASGIELPIQNSSAFEFLFTSCNGKVGNVKVNNQSLSISFLFSFDYYDF